MLLHYAWPGNARELDNVIQRALVLQTQNTIEACHLQLFFDGQEHSMSLNQAIPQTLEDQIVDNKILESKVLENVERE